MPIAYFPTGKYAFPPKSVPGLMTRVSASGAVSTAVAKLSATGFCNTAGSSGNSSQVHELIARQHTANATAPRLVPSGIRFGISVQNFHFLPVLPAAPRAVVTSAPVPAGHCYIAPAPLRGPWLHCFCPPPRGPSPVGGRFGTLWLAHAADEVPGALDVFIEYLRRVCRSEREGPGLGGF